MKKEQEKKIKDLISENLYLKSEQTRLETENENLHGMLKGQEYNQKENKAAVTIQKNFRMKLAQKESKEKRELKEREKAAVVI